LQGLDLGYDCRTLAFQRSEPRHEFGNSDVRSRRRVWRVPAFSVSSYRYRRCVSKIALELTEDLKMRRPNAAQSAEPSRDRALKA
jgi:hypothetical protein